RLALCLLMLLTAATGIVVLVLSAADRLRLLVCLATSWGIYEPAQTTAWQMTQWSWELLTAASACGWPVVESTSVRVAAGLILLADLLLPAAIQAAVFPALPLANAFVQVLGAVSLVAVAFGIGVGEWPTCVSGK